MRFRFLQVLMLASVSAATFAGVARALDFDDEDPHPPHPEIGLAYHCEIGTHAGCIPHHVVVVSGQLPPGLTLTQIAYQTALVSGIATEEGTFSAWLAVGTAKAGVRRRSSPGRSGDGDSASTRRR
jgi:hypothetical protein